MKPSNDLFLLVKSLTKPEKRYFKRFCMLYSAGKKNNYLKLFEVIDKQKVYDERKIKEKFKKETFVKQLSVVKDYLQKTILKSLNSFTSTTDPYVITKDCITEAEILLHRKLYISSWKKIQRAKELSYKYGYYFVLIEAIGDEKLLFKLMNKSAAEKAFNDLITEEEKVLNEIMRIRKYLQYNQIVMNNIYLFGCPVRDIVELEKLQKIINEMSLSDYDNAFAPQAISLYNHTIIFYNISACNYHLSKYYSFKFADYLERNEVIIKNDPTNYFWCLYNLVFSLIKNKNYKLSKKYLVILENFIHSGKYYSTNRNQNEMKLHFYSLKIYFNNKLSKSAENLAEIEKIYKYGLENIYETDETDKLIINIIVTYLSLSYWKDALKWLNYILKNSKIIIYKDISNILNLIVHYELGNYDLLEKLLSRNIKYFSYKKIIHYENIFIKNFKELMCTNQKSDIKKIFERLKNDIKPYLNISTEKEILEDYYIIEWINSKIR